MGTWHIENNFPVLPFVQCCSTCTFQCHVDGVCKTNADKHEGIDLTTVRFILTFGDLFLVILTFYVIMDHPFSTYTYQGLRNVSFSKTLAYVFIHFYKEKKTSIGIIQLGSTQNFQKN